MIKLGNILKEQTDLSVSQQKVNSNINKLLQEQKQSKNNLNEDWKDNIQYIADFAGLIPVYGDIIDAINAIVYFIRGKFFEGVLSIIAIIPGVGSVIALPFKVLFKTLGVAFNPVMKLGAKMLATGQGKLFAKTFTDFCIKQGKTKELKSVIDIVKTHNNTILDVLKPLTSKFDALHKINHILIPNFIEKSIQNMAKTGSKNTKGLIDFFTELGSTPAVAIKSISKDIPDHINIKGNTSDLVKQKSFQPKVGDASVISTYADKTGAPSAWIASPTFGSNLNKSQIVLKRKPGTNEISMITDVSAQPRGYFKEAMGRLSADLPNHKLFEDDSISTDGIIMWSSFLKNGYKATLELFEVPISTVGTKIKFDGVTPSTSKYPEAKFSELGLAERAMELVETKLTKLNLPNATVKIKKLRSIPGMPGIPGKPGRPGTPPEFKLMITLPKLQSTSRSIKYYAPHTTIAGTKAVAKTAQHATKENDIK